MPTQLLPTLPVPDRTRPRLVLAGIGAGYLVALVAVYVLTVRTVPGRLVSDAALRGALSTRSAVSDSVHAVLDVVSVGSLAVTTPVVVVIALLRLAGRAAVVSIGLLAAANVSTWLLKSYLFSRPDLGLREAAPETLNSLPSGHATAAFSAAAALVLVVPVALRGVAAVTGAAVGALVAVATMSAGWHRAGDALAAFCVVGFWSVVAAWVVLRGGDQAVPSRDRWRPPGRTATIALVGGGAGAAVSVLLALVAHDATSTPVTVMALLGGVLLVVGGAFAAMLGILWVVDLAGTGR
ncbi:MAG: phosphatase PAP2 family protein [Nocardioidaceae bacterium]|nr:phosphatase PAP2 family protein [Nocardioidaceae bacterium]